VTISEDKPFITLRGSGAKSTVITWNASGKSSGGTYYSGTVSVLASDFIAKDITIEVRYFNGVLIS
jgi:pectin methylesterase-like acyl-CoA thioesterase